MNFKLGLFTSFVALFFSSYSYSNPIKIQDISGQIQVSVDPLSPSIRLVGSDILIVVDTSGSMQTHQDRLSQQSKILSQTLSKLANVHVGVLSTDVDTNGYGSTKPGILLQPWLSSDSANFESDLAKQIVAGNDGSGYEVPFDSINLFLNQKEIGNNKGFWRSDANLTIILLTDGEDQSTNISSALDFAYLITNTKKNTGLSVGFHALIIPSSQTDTTSCTRDDNSVTPVRIEEVLRILNGISVNLCSDPTAYAKDLTSIADDIAKRAQSTNVGVHVPLPYLPQVQTIKVEYGTMELLPIIQWKYDSVANQIVFPTSFIWYEPAGTLLKISFSLMPQ